MRIQRRNTVQIEVFNNVTYNEVENDDGLKTGDVELDKGEGVEKRCSVSRGNGELVEELFGKVENYEYILLLSNPNIVTNNSLISLEKDSDKLYEVRAIRETLNFTHILIGLH